MTPALRALDRALEEWLTAVRDPRRDDASPDAERCRARIKTYINAGLDKSIPRYGGDGDYAFCGAFTSWCWLAGGLDLAKAKSHAGPDVPGVPFGSTYRLHAAARRCPGFQLARIEDITPGDVVTVDTGKGAPYGDHVVLALAWDRSRSELLAVHANGTGRLPTGEWVEGVVVSPFARTLIRAAYRPDERWLRA